MRIILTRMSLIATILAFVVVVLGAFTRLTDAGLGCPDWPGCYHHLIVPHSSQQAAQHFPQYPLEAGKAWTEMVHRYVAGSLALLILALAIMMFWQRKEDFFSKIPFVLVAVVIFQALLGMWTVTLRLLPVIVMMHLLGGLTILALLWWLFLKLKSPAQSIVATVKPFLWHWWAGLALVILVLQIVLGGWTSSNYAALVCPDFPYCHMRQFFPQADFSAAFNIISSTYSIENGHILQQPALIVIHMSHRIGALITAIVLLGLSIGLLCHDKAAKLRGVGLILALLLLLQVSLGILNVIWLLPLPIAVAHNAVAALLLLTVVTINYFLSPKRN